MSLEEAKEINPLLFFFALPLSHSKKKASRPPPLSRPFSENYSNNGFFPRDLGPRRSRRAHPAGENRVHGAPRRNSARGTEDDDCLVFFFVVVFKEERVELFSSFFDESQFARDDD